MRSSQGETDKVVALMANSSGACRVESKLTCRPYLLPDGSGSLKQPPKQHTLHVAVMHACKACNPVKAARETQGQDA